MKLTLLLSSTGFWLAALGLPVQAQGIPSGYYNGVDATNATTLRITLHNVIDDHSILPYTSGSTDTWDCLRDAQVDPSDSSRILDIYRNRSFSIFDTGYNREHSWPRSFGFPDDNGQNYPFTDCHMLFLSDDGYNTARSNRPYRNCNSSCTEYTTDGGTSGIFAGQSNWGTGSNATGTWQVWEGRKGDIARAMFYADLRYEGGNHGLTGWSEPDLILTDIQSLISSSNTGQNEDTAYMGSLTVLLQWHLDDPVDQFEMDRNDAVQFYQGNRNPFVDHPEWVACLFEDDCGGPQTEVYCSPAVTNSSGNPGIIGFYGSTVATDNTFGLTVNQLPPNQFGYFLCGTARDFIFAPGGSQGNLCLGGTIGRFNALSEIRNSGLFGLFDLQPDLTNFPTNPAQPVLAGQTWTFQCWYRDFNPFSTSNFTDALEVVFE